MIAGIIGATGYVGAELVRLLCGHPEVNDLALSSTSFEGQLLSDVYPNFLGRVGTKLLKAEDLIGESDVVFAALPNGMAEPFAERCMDKGIPFIDMSADFRFDDDEESYKAWYGKPYTNRDLHKNSVYGLCELNRGKIQEKARPSGLLSAIDGGKPEALIVGNPGCYPTCASLAAYPALVKGLVGEGTIIIDAASGVTGGGRELLRAYHFPECNDSLTAYKVGAHRHTPEISRNFRKMESPEKNRDGAKEYPAQMENERPIIFTPHLAPMNRGILATLYIGLAQKYQISRHDGASPRPPTKEIETLEDDIRTLYTQFYQNEQFVRVLPKGLYATTGRVRLSNYCDISTHIDQSGRTLIVTAAIDNMIKGAAGQAVQNMNIIFGFHENSGLEYIPALF
ncbi:MAG: N-acetyl-gamma-glutamyl-phosphate reductase [Spirochaetaceae bacterium]|jgi:N-acetyl-gamma-glutamyl-phosphate reductase|nr:N-acetyl-gamma-glutamyl-phosphate reductase [Spirochaetaceae bacterium]